MPERFELSCSKKCTHEEAAWLPSAILPRQLVERALSNTQVDRRIRNFNPQEFRAYNLFEDRQVA